MNLLRILAGFRSRRAEPPAAEPAPAEDVGAARVVSEALEKAGLAYGAGHCDAAVQVALYVAVEGPHELQRYGTAWLLLREPPPHALRAVLGNGTSLPQKQEAARLLFQVSPDSITDMILAYQWGDPSLKDEIVAASMRSMSRLVELACATGGDTQERFLTLILNHVAWRSGWAYCLLCKHRESPCLPSECVQVLFDRFIHPCEGDEDLLPRNADQRRRQILWILGNYPESENLFPLAILEEVRPPRKVCEEVQEHGFEARLESLLRGLN